MNLQKKKGRPASGRCFHVLETVIPAGFARFFTEKIRKLFSMIILKAGGSFWIFHKNIGEIHGGIQSSNIKVYRCNKIQGTPIDFIGIGSIIECRYVLFNELKFSNI